MANWDLASGTSNNFVFPLDLLKDGSKYTISAEILDNSIGYFYVEESANGFLTDTNHQIHMPNTSNMPYTFEKKKGHEYRLFWFDSSGHTLNDFATNIQLEEGETATGYEPYLDPSTVTVRRCGKNIYKVTAKTQTTNGLTFTVNNDGSVIVNGTAEKTTFIGLGAFHLKSGEKYHLSGSPAGSGFDTYMLYIHNNTTGADIYDLGEGKVFTGTTGDLGLTIAVYADNTVNNLTFHPMIVYGEESVPFESYNGTEHTPSADGTVEGITSLSPNMTILTDTSGAIVECEYIKDTNKVLQKIADALGITI